MKTISIRILVAAAGGALTISWRSSSGGSEDRANAIGSDHCAISTASACAAVSACLGY
jgi:hypothetical protein